MQGLFFYVFIRELVYEYVPTEYIFDLAALESLDVVVEDERLRTALAVTVCVHSLLIRLEERLVYKLVHRSDHNCCTAFSDLVECTELICMNRSSLDLHTEVCRNSLERHVCDRRED